MPGPKNRMNGNTAQRFRAKIRLLLEQGFRCFWCGMTFRPDMVRGVPAGQKQPPEIATFDHVIPIAQGGKRGIENLVIACRACNERRGHETQYRRNKEST